MNRKEFLAYPKLIRFRIEDCENDLKSIDIALEKLKDKKVNNYDITFTMLIGYTRYTYKSIDITTLNLSVKDIINIINNTRKRIVKERDFLVMKERDFLIK